MPHTVITPEATWILDHLTLPVMVLDRDLCFVYCNDSYLETVHRERGELIGRYVFEAFPETPERIESVRDPMLRALAGEVTKLEALPFHIELEDGSVEELVWEATQEPVRNRDGEIIGMLQRTQEITERYKLQKRNEAIGHELSHRVKNIMAVVSSVARITGRNATDVKDFVSSFTARISAMSRTNDLLSLSNWSGLDVESIFTDELSPYASEAGDNLSIGGPNVTLNIDASKDLSMVVHELATNAAKYGCLGKGGGNLSVKWRRTKTGVVISWKENCVHRIETPTKIGFGTRLFDMLPYIEVDRDFTPSGLHLTITMDGDSVFA